MSISIKLATALKEPKLAFNDLKNNEQKNRFMMIYEAAKDKDLRLKEKERFSTMALNIDLKMDAKNITNEGADKFQLNPNGKVTPIGLLAVNGNHEGVEFLISCGSSPIFAVEGYELGGYFSTEETISEILMSIADSDIRLEIAQEINDKVSFDIMQPLLKNLAYK